jgi:hypothetical protein
LNGIEEDFAKVRKLQKRIQLFKEEKKMMKGKCLSTRIFFTRKSL